MIALLAGVGDIGFSGFLLGDFLRRGYLLLGQVGQLVDFFAIFLARGGRVRRFQGSARFTEFAWRIGRHDRVRLRRHVVAAGLIEQAGGGRCGAAGGDKGGHGQQAGNGGVVSFFHDGVLVIVISYCFGAC
ncbi:hypothetical protein D3C81_1711000 [compost metagenome]